MALGCFLAAFLLSAALAAVSAWHRAPWSDEGQFSSAAWTLARHGYLGTPVLDPAAAGLPRIDRVTYWVFPLYLVAQALWYLVAPATLAATRLMNVAWLALAMWGLKETGARLVDPRAGRPAAILMALNYVIVDNTGFARPDMMCMALGLAGIGWYLRWRESRLTLAAAGGYALVALSGMTHPNGVLPLACLIAIMLALDRGRLRWRPLAAAAGVCAALAAGWGWYVLQDFDAFRAQMAANSSWGRIARDFAPWNLVASEWRERYAVTYGLASPSPLIRLKAYALVLYAAAAVWVLASFRRGRASLWPLGLIAIVFSIQCVFNQKLSYYLVHIVPWFCLLLAQAALSWTASGLAWRRAAVAAALGGLVLLDTGGILIRARQRSEAAILRQLSGYVSGECRDAGRLFGSAGLLYALEFDARLDDDHRLGLASGKSGEVFLFAEELYGHLYRLERAAPAGRIPWPHLEARLSEYRTVRRWPGYQVCFHRDFRKEVPGEPLWLP